MQILDCALRGWNVWATIAMTDGYVLLWYCGMKVLFQPFIFYSYFEVYIYWGLVYPPHQQICTLQWHPLGISDRPNSWVRVTSHRFLISQFVFFFVITIVTHSLASNQQRESTQCFLPASKYLPFLGCLVQLQNQVFLGSPLLYPQGPWWSCFPDFLSESRLGPIFDHGQASHRGWFYNIIM